MSIESWIAFVLALTVLGISPGPAWAAVVTTSITRGFGAAVAMSIGIGVADVVFLLLAIFGLTMLAKILGTFFFVIKIACAGYLIWLGIKFWRHPPTVPDDMPAPKRSFGSFLGGFLLTLSNPKAIAFYLGFLPAFIDLSVLTHWNIVLLVATTFTVIAGMLSGYAAVAVSSRRFLRKTKTRQRVGRILGATLIGTGVVVATR